MNLKNYNVLNALKDLKEFVFLIILVGIILYLYFGSKDKLTVYLAIIQFLSIIFLTIKDFHNFTTVRKYIVENEIEINIKYQIETGVGYSNFYRNLSDSELNKLLSSKVKTEFIACYIFPIKILMTFMLLVIFFICISILK